MPNITENYKWILQIAGSPKLIAEGLLLTGIKEYPGKANNNPVIMNMARDLGIGIDIYPNDETAWCALAHNWLCWKTGKPLSGKNYDLVRAKSFENWGIYTPIPMYGDTCIFKRDGGYHVGSYVAEDITHYHILGGNQRNSYGFARLEKKRLHTCRRYYATAAPACVRPYIVSPVGMISKNEA